MGQEVRNEFACLILHGFVEIRRDIWFGVLEWDISVIVWYRNQGTIVSFCAAIVMVVILRSSCFLCMCLLRSCFVYLYFVCFLLFRFEAASTDLTELENKKKGLANTIDNLMNEVCI